MRFQKACHLDKFKKLLDCTPTSLDGSKRGLQVNSKLWDMLHQGEQHACDAIEKRVRATVKDHPDLELVICGHGVGGALAVLVAAALMDHDVDIAAVMAFGCPQVIVLDPSNRLWRQLHDKTTLYINAFDSLARAPWCFQTTTDGMPPRALRERSAEPRTLEHFIEGEFLSLPRD